MTEPDHEIVRITPLDQLAAVDLIEHGTTAALTCLHEGEASLLGYENAALVEAVEQIVGVMLVDAAVLHATVITFCEALASADVVAESLGRERGELLQAVLAGLRANYERWNADAA
jgi:hypothetical protein